METIGKTPDREANSPSIWTANERTFLAWVRTSLSTISVGVGITQLFRLEKELQLPGQLLGVAFIVIGMLFLVFACIRFFHAQVAMTEGYFPATRGMVMITVTATFTALISLLVVVYRGTSI
ncbi:hypothetical protein BDB00DRAFT_774761 [Zychaea mexicana]|uniref:uncharacterized protein n=1 Tax=Zychaea mexicana TaxID=64656 RepID=UPI0022FE4BB0|nr:uncharacterized protein BDB00DRAFT_774761 [Zychaea mexicana]KAI9484533.1 hypothetical protein BDB00DRAFT_774761 [Zychaea mexicana]